MPLNKKSYILRQTSRKGAELDQPFVLQELLGERRQREFPNFEQVMQFLLAELFDEAESEPVRAKD
jgi:hypothetical protein